MWCINDIYSGFESSISWVSPRLIAGPFLVNPDEFQAVILNKKYIHLMNIPTDKISRFSSKSDRWSAKFVQISSICMSAIIQLDVWIKWK